MKFLVVLYLILLVEVERTFTFDSYEDYIDPVLYYLLNGNDTVLSELNDKSNEKLDVARESKNVMAIGITCPIPGVLDRTIHSNPVFQDGIWKCGRCDKINEKRLIYNEINDVDTNIDDDNFLQVQVGLAFDEMRCVTIQSDEENYDVKRITGTCTGPTVTLYVSNAQHFDVRVFKD